MQGSSKRLSTAERTAALQSFKKSRRQMSAKQMEAQASNGNANGNANGDSFRSGDVSDPDADRGMVLPFEPVVMTFKDVQYWVNCPPVSHRQIPSLPASL